MYFRKLYNNLHAYKSRNVLAFSQQHQQNRPHRSCKSRAVFNVDAMRFRAPDGKQFPRRPLGIQERDSRVSIAKISSQASKWSERSIVSQPWVRFVLQEQLHHIVAFAKMKRGILERISSMNRSSKRKKEPGNYDFIRKCCLHQSSPRHLCFQRLIYWPFSS